MKLRTKLLKRLEIAGVNQLFENQLFNLVGMFMLKFMRAKSTPFPRATESKDNFLRVSTLTLTAYIHKPPPNPNPNPTRCPSGNVHTSFSGGLGMFSKYPPINVGTILATRISSSTRKSSKLTAIATL